MHGLVLGVEATVANARSGNVTTMIPHRHRHGDLRREPVVGLPPPRGGRTAEDCPLSYAQCRHPDARTAGERVRRHPMHPASDSNEFAGYDEPPDRRPVDTEAPRVGRGDHTVEFERVVTQPEWDRHVYLDAPTVRAVPLLTL